MQALAKATDNHVLYEQVLSRIFKWNVFRPQQNLKQGLDSMRALAHIFDNPQNSFKAIHVAGTNGKGSVCLKTARALQAANFRTGLFTSPHISCFRERIQVNGAKISEEETVKWANQIFEVVEKHSLETTFFEIITMMSFLHFREQKVDYAVIECGIGARLDATNIIDVPKATAITSVGLDHVPVLGETEELIAKEKAFVMKKGAVCVLGPTANQESIRKHAEEVQVKLVQVSGTTFKNSNNAIVNQLLDHLEDPIPDSARQAGLSAEQPCRLQMVSSAQISSVLSEQADGIVYLDVGHNPQGIAQVLADLAVLHPDKEVQVACAFSMGKDVSEILSIMARSPQVAQITVFTNNHFRIEGIEAAKKKMHEVAQSFSEEERRKLRVLGEEGKLEVALRENLKECVKNDMVLLVCGSFFVMQDVRQFFGFDDDQDPMSINAK